MFQRHNKFLEVRGSRGFTIVELMVTVAVMAILAAIGVPSMQGLVRNFRLNGAAGEMSAALQLARSEATRRNARVMVCPSSDGLVCGSGTNWTRWIVLGAANNSSAAEVLRDESVPSTVRVSGPTGGIQFNPSGMVSTQRVVTVCIPTTNPGNNQRQFTVMVSGTARVASVNGGGACP